MKREVIQDKVYKCVFGRIGLPDLPDVNIKYIKDTLLDGVWYRKVRINTIDPLPKRKNDLIEIDFVEDEIPAYILVPKKISEKLYGILACHSHAKNYEIGKSEVIGFKERLTGLRTHYGIELAKKGYVVIAPDMLGFEERKPERFDNEGMFTHGERMFTSNYHNMGFSLLGKNMIDLKMSLNALESLDETNDYFGVIGHSMGGIHAPYLTALDARITAGVQNCGLVTYLDEYEHQWIQCFPFNAPLMGEGIDSPELLALISPRPYMIISGKEDVTLRHSGAREMFELAKRYYIEDGSPENLVFVPFEGGHEFPDEQRETAYDFLNEHLK